MARIQIADLPLLEDLTPEQLKELFGAGAKAFKPSFEALEDRQLMSVSTLLPTLTSAQLALISTPSAQPSTTQLTPVNTLAQTNDFTAIQPLTGASNTSPTAVAQPALTNPITGIQPDTVLVPVDQKSTGTDAVLAAFSSINTQSILSNSLRDDGKNAIDTKVSKLSQLGVSLGKSLNDAYLAPTLAGELPTGVIQDFEGGKSIYWSRATGAHLVTGLIRDTYLSFGTHWGYPKSDDVVIVVAPGDVRVVNDFTLRGGNGIASIVWSSRTANVGPQVIIGGAIWSQWVALGATGSLVPVTGDYALPDGGRAQDFLGGTENDRLTITWTKDAGTQLIDGPIRDKWAKLPEFGAPVGEVDIGGYGGFGHSVDRQVFTVSGGFFGTIVHDSFTNETHEVHGAIWQKWQDLKNWLPISDEISIDGGKIRYNNFVTEEGLQTQLVWFQATGEVVMVTIGPYNSGMKSLTGAGLSLAPQGFGFSAAAAMGSPAATPTSSIDLSAPYQPVTDATWAGYLSSPIASVGDQGLWANNATILFSQALAPSADNVIDFNSPSKPISSLDPFTSYTAVKKDTGLGQDVIAGLAGTYERAPYFGSDMGSIAPYVTRLELDSNPGAAKTIFLDFQSFPTADEQREIWQRVAEDFAPFNVNVTTHWSGSLVDRSMVRVVVGGKSVAAQGTADPYGLSDFDSMRLGGSNVVHVFADSIRALGGNFATLAANVASREVGHAYGLRYQLQTDSTSGVSDVTPQANLMGTRIGVELTRWAQEAVAVPSDVSPNAWAWQDDLKILTGALGFREQGPGGYGGFTNLGSVEDTGILQGQGTIIMPFVIRQAGDTSPPAIDVDTYIFDTQGGRIHFAVQGIGAGQNLGAHFEVWASAVSGRALQTTITQKMGESPAVYGDLNAALTMNLPKGTYFVKVMGSTEYGNYGKYTLTIQKGSVIDVTDAYQTRSAIAPDQLQSRLVELDQAIAQSQQDLQGTLDAQAQYAAEGEQIEADIQAATELSPDETASDLADLQTRQAQNAAALEQNQQQIVLIQNQLDLFTMEQTLIGSTLADADAAQARQATDFTGATFSLTSLDSRDVHQLQIQDQSNYLPAVDSVRQQYPGGVVGAVRQEVPSAAQPTISIDVIWDGTSQAGTLSRDEAGNVLIRFNWFRLDDGTLHTFMGTITGEAGSYHIEATDTLRGGGVSDAMAGDQAVAGDQTMAPAPSVTDFTNVSLSITDDIGAAHQFQIQTQTAEADGTATFTGVWNGQDGTGTLASDDAGNVHMTFNADNYNFDGTLSGSAGAYHIDGNLTGGDGSPVHAAGDQSVAHVFSVTDFTNVSFALIDDNGTAHQLQIQTQAAQPDGTATFTGLWNGQDGAGEQVTGTLVYDDAGNVHIVLSGDNESLDGTLSGNPGAYHMEGTLTMLGSDPVHVAGDQTAAQISQVTFFTNVSFSLTDDNGTAHQLQIQTQAAQPDGTAAFTGVWNGQDSTGTLAYDADGNVHMTFNADDYSFDGTISGAPDAYHLDGSLMVLGSDPVHVAGDQSA